MLKILFVCTGNTCRSPMAQVLAQRLFEDNGLDFIADSAGIFATDGTAASANAKKVVKIHYNLDLAKHSSKRVTSQIMEDSWAVLCVTAGHKTNLVANYPQYAEKIFSFTDVCENCSDVSDPFGDDVKVYEDCAMQIKNTLDEIIWREIR
ncbi:MAG: low molecular weight protein arginine phosphatase [Defluviitaleaceae bacterium]|nr:low molecular weight protein arginine phosphatase [Defluviitaleaceae bacterium]